MVGVGSKPLHVISMLLIGLLKDISRYDRYRSNYPYSVGRMDPHFQLSIIRSATGLIDYAIDEFSLKKGATISNGNFSMRFNYVINMADLDESQIKARRDAKRLCEGLVALRNWASHPKLVEVEHERLADGGLVLHSAPKKLLSFEMVYSYVADVLEVLEVLSNMWPCDNQSSWRDLHPLKCDYDRFHSKYYTDYPKSKEDTVGLGLSAISAGLVLTLRPIDSTNNQPS